MAIATNETLWLQHLLEELAFPVVYPTVINEDNQAAIAIATNQKNPALAKHIDTKYHAIQDYILKGYIDVRYKETKHQLADGLTKVKTNTKEADLLLGRPPDSTVQNQGVC